MNSPSFIFNVDQFHEQVKKVKQALGEKIPLCYSIKANPFLLRYLPEELSKVEVCSPGELRICKELQIDPKVIIYSGVMKEFCDIMEAVEYDVSILTAESKLHVELENRACIEVGKKKDVILRLTSGNQFGMSVQDIEEIISEREKYTGIRVIGIHYYSGTQKKQRSIEKDFTKLDALLTLLREKYSFDAQLVEYGPGLPVDYFNPPYEETDDKTLEEFHDKMSEFASKYPLGIEMGRFLATSCGYYLTTVKDLKNSSDTNYVILDGGIHHLKYHGQTMAMQIPPIAHRRLNNLERLDLEELAKDERGSASKLLEPYTLCGSLCTVADVLVREVELPKLALGDTLIFKRCGAYSVTEGTILFLSRNMPAIRLYSQEFGMQEVRPLTPSYTMNF